MAFNFDKSTKIEVEKNTAQLRPTKHGFKLNFGRSTKIKEQDFQLDMLVHFSLCCKTCIVDLTEA